MNYPEKILKKLDSCTERYEDLVALVPRVVGADPTKARLEWAAAERLLQVVLDCAIDVGEMLIAWKRLQYAEENRDVFLTLGRAGVLDDALAAKMAKAAGLRNVLVHMYDALDYDRLKRTLATDVKDYAEYARQVAAYARQG